MSLRAIITTLLLVILAMIPSLPAEIQASIAHKIFMPQMSSGLDDRFGITEYNCEEMRQLGFACNNPSRFHAQGGIDMPGEEDTVFYGWSAHRQLVWPGQELPDGWPTELYCKFAYKLEGKKDRCAGGAIATETGLVDPVGLCEFLSARPWVSVIVGNEESSQPAVISSELEPEEYAEMYHAFWSTIKACSPDTRVGPYAPVQQHTAEPTVTKEYFEAWHAAYDGIVPLNFQSLHFYARPDFDLEEVWIALLEWKAWVTERVETDVWFLTEYGFPCWLPNIPREGPEVERFMKEFSCRLQKTDEFESWAWWGHACYLLGDEGPTGLGVLYRKIAIGTSLNDTAEIGGCD